jgi:hypothetical protein
MDSIVMNKYYLICEANLNKVRGSLFQEAGSRVYSTSGDNPWKMKLIEIRYAHRQHSMPRLGDHQTGKQESNFAATCRCPRTRRYFPATYLFRGKAVNFCTFPTSRSRRVFCYGVDNGKFKRTEGESTKSSSLEMKEIFGREELLNTNINSTRSYIS